MATVRRFYNVRMVDTYEVGDSEIDAVEASAVSELAAVLLAPERISAAGIGPDEGRFLAAVEGGYPELSGRAAAA